MLTIGQIASLCFRFTRHACLLIFTGLIFLVCYRHQLAIFAAKLFFLTLPTAKARRILASTTTALANILRYHNVLHSVHKLDYTVPVCPTVQFMYLYADCICSPLFKIFMLALVSRLCTAWQIGHSHTRIARFFTSGFLYPQQEHV